MPLHASLIDRLSVPPYIVRFPHRSLLHGLPQIISTVDSTSRDGMLFETHRFRGRQTVMIDKARD